jgi:hypothetical protein
VEVVLLIWSNGRTSRVLFPVASLIAMTRSRYELSDLPKPAHKYEERKGTVTLRSTHATRAFQFDLLDRNHPSIFLQGYCDVCGCWDCNKIATGEAISDATLLTCILEVVGRLTGCSGVCSHSRQISEEDLFQVKTASFQILSNLYFLNHPTLYCLDSVRAYTCIL